MNDIYENVVECALNKKHKMLIVFDIIVDMLDNKKIEAIELFIRKRNKNFSCFYSTILFCCTKNVMLYSTHYFIMKQ